jgi:hypothetical protein
MTFRYRSSIRLARGLRINLSKSGASLSVGGRGATVNLGRRGIRGEGGIPQMRYRSSSGHMARGAALFVLVVAIAVLAVMVW